MQTKNGITILVVISLVGCGMVFTTSSGVNSEEMYSNDGSAPKAGLRVTFFGTTTILLTDGITSIMIDGFFSRPSLRHFLYIKPNAKRIHFALSKAPSTIDAIFVAHSHHDHSMDSGFVAQKTNAILYGSESTLNIARGQNTLSNQLRLLKANQPTQVGTFRVTAIETPHSLDAKFVGFIHKPLYETKNVSNYLMGENFSFIIEHSLGNVLIVPSANYSKQMFDGYRADIVFLGIGTLGKQPNEFVGEYWDETIKKTGAKLVFPIHWDDFTKPLCKPLVPLPFFVDNMSLTMDRLRFLSERDKVQVRILPTLQEVTLPRGKEK